MRGSASVDGRTRLQLGRFSIGREEGCLVVCRSTSPRRAGRVDRPATIVALRPTRLRPRELVDVRK